MQIRIFPENGIPMTMGKAAQIKNQSAQISGSVFGAQCKVTISKEGRKLSEQSGLQTARSAQSLKAEKTLIRQQEESAQVESIRDKYMAQLKEIDKTIKCLSGSSGAGADEVTKEKKQQVLEAMRKQLQTQLEENRRKQQDVQQMAKQSFDTQDEIDRKNRDLLIMLKSIEKSEEEEQKNGSSGAESGSSGSDGAKNSVSDVIQDTATQFSVSSMERELNVVGMIDALEEDGHYYLGKADEITTSVMKESLGLRELLDDENDTDEQKAQEMSRYQDKMVSAYKEVQQYRRRGLQMIKDSRECKIQHIADDPLKGVKEAKESMMLSAREAAIHEASNSKLDEASQELKDEVEKLIDARNEVTHVESDEKEKGEEHKEIGDISGSQKQDQAQQ